MITNPTPTQQETLERCPLDHAEEKGLHINSSSGMRKWHITCFDCGLYLEGMLDETIRSLAQRWNTRAAVAGPRSVVNLEAWTSIDAWLREHPKASAAECLAELVRRIETETAAASSPAPAEKCIECGHSIVDRHGECRQCVDWKRHKCIFPEGAQVCRHCREQIRQTSGWVHTATNLAICRGDSGDGLFRAAPAERTPVAGEQNTMEAWLKEIESACNSALLDIYDLSIANAPIPAKDSRNIADCIGHRVGQIREAVAAIRAAVPAGND